MKGLDNAATLDGGYGLAIYSLRTRATNFFDERNEQSNLDSYTTGKET